MKQPLCIAAFVLGLLAIVWVGAGYLVGHPLALSVTLLIGAVYLAGALEMRRFHRGTSLLAHALDALVDTPAVLDAFLEKVPRSLQPAVRRRIEGERIALPGPALTPYLVGLLVMLGMLGTFLGMVVTLNGAVIALEGTTDLATIRAALAAPIKGLGVAFGTSVAGVSASAMLGLISSLCRRERLAVGQVLEDRIAGPLRPFSHVQQREDAFAALQQQAQALPEVMGSLKELVTALAQQNEQAQTRLVTNQEGFHREVSQAYTALAQSVGQSLQSSLQQGAKVAGDTLRPAVETAMAAIARESEALQQRLERSITAQMEGLAQQIDSTIRGVETAWREGAQQQASTNAALVTTLHGTLNGVGEGFAQQGTQLVDQLHTALNQRDEARLSAITHGLGELSATLEAGWRQAGEAADARSTQLAATLEQLTRAQSEQMQAQTHATVDEVARLMELVTTLHGTLNGVGEGFAQQGTQLVDQLHTALNQRDEARLSAITHGLGELSATLEAGWRQAGEAADARSTQLATTLEQLTRAQSEQLQAQTSATLAEVARLMETAAAAPRAAAEVIGELRNSLSESMARDNATLDERARVMATLNTVLEAVNHASVEQRNVIDTLLANTADMLQTIGARFTEQAERDAQHIATEAGKLAETAVQTSASAVELASLGDAFAAAVAQFGASSEALVAQMQRIEAGLDKSMARSDEQLAYYVAQAREVIDLSLMSQQRILDDLQGRSTGTAGALAGTPTA